MRTFLAPISILSVILTQPFFLYASENTVNSEAGGGHNTAAVFLILAVLLIVSKLGSIVEKIGQPSVLGELLAGIVLSAVAFLGVPFFQSLTHNEIVAFLAETGAVILLFQIGLESNIQKMMKTGVAAIMVALVGVILPFVLGTFVAGPLLFSGAPFVSHLFIGASLVATSVGITVSVFRSMKSSKSSLCQIVLGAAVFDDVLGLLVLAVVTAIAAGGQVTPAFVTILTLKAFGFLAASVVLGSVLAKPISTLFSKINSAHGMKLAVALSFGFLFAYLSSLVGLAPIVGAFAAGLVLDGVHFSMYEKPSLAYDLEKLMANSGNAASEVKSLAHKLSHTHIEDMIASLSLLFVPFFFVYTGMQIDFGSLLQPQLYVGAFIVTVLGIVGKVAAGFASKGTLLEKLTIGVAMVPRGEVGLIFASVGKATGAISTEIFSLIVLVIMATTFFAPPVLKILLDRLKKSASVKSAQPSGSLAYLQSYAVGKNRKEKK